MIEVNDLTKHFFVRKRTSQRGLRHWLGGGVVTVKAVESLSFKVAKGEIVGYLGPNGAGKSTTIKMLTGLLVPSHGSVTVGGFVPWRERRRYAATIGAVFGQRTTLWWDLPVIDSLNLLRYIYKIPESTFRHNLNSFEIVLGLSSFLHTPVRALSLGQRMRADLCAALLHNPAVLFLDEPTIGLDVVAKTRIRQFIQHVNATLGTTVILTTHDLADVQKLCQRVMIIDQGKLLYDGALSTLQTRFGGDWQLIADFTESYDSVSLRGAKLLSYKNSRAIFSFDRQQVSTSALIGELTRHYAIRDLMVQEPDIESTIRTIYEDKLLT
jgi:ABC-2 type transport system ATP-binding protein